MPAKNANELIALAKASPGKLNMASGGAGTGQHLAGELFNMMAGIQMLHIPYKGTAPAIADIMGGHADLTFSDPSVLPQVKSGKLKAIGVSGTQRYEPLPDVPVIAQSGSARLRRDQLVSDDGAGTNAERHRRAHERRSAESPEGSERAREADEPGSDPVGQFTGRARGVHPARHQALGTGGQGDGRQAGLKRRMH